MNMERTTASAHSRIDILEKTVIAIETEVRIQFKDLFARVKRLEAILVTASGAILALLVSILAKLG
tara:strand:- start:677 stop:874 length:198 start_codon:yes stop_codon:yes gene_type:complete